jgi:hypothetical protein
MKQIAFLILLIVLHFSKVDSFFDTFSQLKAVNIVADNEQDKECKSQLKLFSDALEKRENWAVESKLTI